MSRRFDRILYAPNIHQGGGRTLLLPLLDAMERDTNVLLILDKRLQDKISADMHHIMWVEPSLSGRLLAEIQLLRLVSPHAVLVALGNLPPLFARCQVMRVFLQNRYMIEKRDMDEWPWAIRIRIAIERLWFRARRYVVSEFIVQTETMRRLLSQMGENHVRVRPFFDIPKKVCFDETEKKYDYLYVASGEPHKNHRFLVKGWCELARRGFFPSLCLTLKSGPKELVSWISEMTEKYGLNITMDGLEEEGDIHKLYGKSRALIYPSTFESLGLPLLEASVYGLPVVAADVDYVHDVIKPSATFSVGNEDSLIEAVLGAPYDPSVTLMEWLSPSEFAIEIFRAKP